MYSSANRRCLDPKPNSSNLPIFHHLQSKKAGTSYAYRPNAIMGTAGIEPAHSVMPWTSHGLAQGATLANFQSWLMFHTDSVHRCRTQHPMATALCLFLRDRLPRGFYHNPLF
ncbi:TPA: hypothetical protein ACGO4D_001093 [Streptococcus suis]